MGRLLLDIIVCLGLIWNVGATCLYPPPIASQADADQFSICPTVTGDITIATNAVGNIKINGPKVIEGNLVSAQCLAASNCTGMKSLSSSTLQTIDKDFHLQGIQNLTRINFPVLETVENLIFLDLFSVETVAFDKGLSKVTGGTVNIEGLSSLQNLSGLAFTDIDYLSIQTGPLAEFRLSVEQASEFFRVGGDGTLHLDAPALKSTLSLTVFGCADVNLAGLETSGNVDFEQNTFTILSLPAFVSSSYSYFTIGDNVDLTAINLPGIEELDTLWVWGNPALLNIDGFSKLKVADSVKVSGNFTQFSLPAANAIGEFIIESGSTAFNCSTFDLQRNASTIKGYYECQGSSLATVTSAALRLIVDNGMMACLGLIGAIMIIL